MKTIGQMIQSLQGLVGTRDVTPWEGQFITDIARKTNDGKHTTHLSEKQVDVIERLHKEHFA